ncbi:hypothetical protein FE257_000586 [Aspergillus nanangensis]|uniref:AAA+ ATPase domain-containing protein n=1 Tax=Aspergillus nanangensis TaxID=2582783 RepID=A0AAD4CEW1_ASPNN|nr:hypothetical protein FE257_000586 [Aspergillus nanangensis]
MRDATQVLASNELARAITTSVTGEEPDAEKKITKSKALSGEKDSKGPSAESSTKEPQSNSSTTSDPSDDKTTKPTPPQEIKITRVPPENWREVKKKRQLDPEQSILLTSSKGSSSLVLRQAQRKRQISIPKIGLAAKEPDPLQRDHQYAPYRLAINSKFLLNVLEACTGALFTEEQNVLVRPFKYLVEFEPSIREYLKTAEASCDQVAEEMEAFLSAGPEVSDSMQQEMERVKEIASQTKRERDELRCLVEFMTSDMRDIFNMKRLISDGNLEEIAFEHLWLLFKPGDVVYRTVHDDGSRRQALRVLHVTGGRACFDTKKMSSFDPVYGRQWDSESDEDRKCRETVKRSGMQMTNFIIDCFYLEWDGVRLAPRPKRYAITPYSGARSIASLPLRPLAIDPQKEEIVKGLVARGERFMQLAHRRHMVYHGTTIEESRHGPYRYANWRIESFEIHGEVVVDQEAGVTHFQDTFSTFTLRTGGGVILAHTESDTREVSDFFPQKSDGDWVTDVIDDGGFEEYRQNEYLITTDLLTIRIIQPGSCLPDEHLLLLPPRVYGYSLLDRRWVALNVSLLQDMSTKEKERKQSTLDDLVLPEEHKMALQALITNQIRLPHGSSSPYDDTAQDQFSMDVVPAKGKGLIILLHGAPGVGKTSTAECIAIQLNRPLLPITCGHIGTTAYEAEEKLEVFCKLAHRWRCVLLLDEADVFLAKRERGDIKRNSLVSVFLRVLEYFSGVIILTTNRVGEFDEAFRSRIHVCLYYPKLGEHETKEIWEKNIQRIKDSDLEIDVQEKRIRQFSDEHWKRNLERPTRRWNGRQIKNAFQTAIALANWEFYDKGNVAKLDRPLLKAKHFRHVAQITGHFDDYISDIHGTSDQDTYEFLAARDSLRTEKDPVMFGARGDMMEGSSARGLKSGIIRRGTGYRSPPPKSYKSKGFGYDRHRSETDSQNSDEDEQESDTADDEEGDDDDDDDDNKANEIKQLELELKLAKLKKSRGLSRGSKK